ncbi:MAG TPA: TolC family protein [Polyangiales bacterium]
MGRWASFAVCVALLAGWAGGRVAADSSASAPMTLQLALRAGAQKGPGIEASAAPMSGLVSARQAARAWLVAPPIVTVGAGPRLNGGASLDVQATALAQLPLRDLRGARGQVANTSIDLVHADTRRARFDGALRAAIAWSYGVEAKEVMRLRHEALEQSEAIAATAKKRAQAGVSMPSELAVTLGDVGVARAGVLDAEGVLVEALAELRLATGESIAAPVDPVGELYEQDNDTLNRAAKWASEADTKNPGLRVAQKRQSVAQQETALVSATLGPSLGVGASYTREGTGNSIVLGVVSVPIPLVDHAAFERSRAQAQADVSAAEVRQVRTELKTQLAVAMHDIQHFRELCETLKTDALPPLREALRLATAQFSAGTQEIGLVLVARQRLIATEELFAHAAGEVVRADLRMAYVAGTLLPEGT